MTSTGRSHPGEIFCLPGANGAGKTTTISLFLNFITPTRGEARINGCVVAEHPIETRQWLAYIPEQVLLYRNFTGLENLDYFSELAGKHYTRRELLNWLASVKTSPYRRWRDRPPSSPTCARCGKPMSRHGTAVTNGVCAWRGFHRRP